MPISLGEDTISVEQAEEVLRATAREWAVSCFLDLAKTDAVIHEGVIRALEAAVLDAVGGTVVLGDRGLPELPLVTVLRRHLAGEKGVLTRLQTESCAARISPAEYPEAERRRREDLLASAPSPWPLCASTRASARGSAYAAIVAQRVALLAGPDGDQAAQLSVSERLPSCCAARCTSESQPALRPMSRRSYHSSVRWRRAQRRQSTGPRRSRRSGLFELRADGLAVRPWVVARAQKRASRPKERAGEGIASPGLSTSH